MLTWHYDNQIKMDHIESTLEADQPQNIYFITIDGEIIVESQYNNETNHSNPCKVISLKRIVTLLIMVIVLVGIPYIIITGYSKNSMLLFMARPTILFGFVGNIIPAIIILRNENMKSFARKKIANILTKLIPNLNKVTPIAQ